MEPVHQQPHGIDGEDLLPRKRAQPQLAGPSGPARTQFCHSGLGARSARLLQRHRPDGAEPQAAPDAVRQLGDHGANWFELIAFQRKIKIFSRSDEHFFFSVTFCVGFCSVPDSTASQRVGAAALQVQRSEELSGGLVQLLARLLNPLQGGEGRGRQEDREALRDLLADELLLHLVELSLDLRQRGNVARANPALPQGLTLLTERLAALLALLGHRGSGAAGCALVEALAKLEPKLLGMLQHVPPVLHVDLLSREPAGDPVSQQPLQHGRSPSKLVMQAAHLLQRGSPLQRLGIGSGPQQRPQLLAALQDVGGHSEFFNEQKNRLRHRKKLQRALHTQIRDLKTQAAHAAHQPQAARSQPNARGAVSQLSGAVRKRAAGVPEARVGRQLGLQHPIAAARLPHRRQQPLAHGLGRELRVEDALGCGRQLLDQIGLGPLPEEPRALVGCEAHTGALPLGEGPGLPWDFQRSFALPKQRLQAQEFATLSIGAHLAQVPHASLARHPFLSPIKKDWSEHANLEPRPRLCVLRCAGGGY